MTIEELRRLEAAATEGPWECAWGAQRQPIARAFSTKADTDGKAFGLYGATMVPIRVDEDMELCAALRNHARALFAVVEAARRIARMVGSGEQGSGKIITAGECKALWDALAELEAAK